MMEFMTVAIIIVTISMIAIIIRLVKGPTSSDRVISLDAIGVCLISIIGLFSILADTPFYLEIILLLAILSFIGTVAFSKFIEKGDIIERDNSSK